MAVATSIVETPLDPEQASAAGEAARQLAEYIRAEHPVERLVLRTGDPSGPASPPLIVPAAALHLFQAVLTALAAGDAVTVVSIDAELTTQQAADLLNVSRPYLVKLIETNELPARLVGTHRRVRVKDLLDYRRRDDEQRDAVLDELTAEAQELGLGYQ